MPAWTRAYRRSPPARPNGRAPCSPCSTQHGAEMDRRREVTPEVVDALVAGRHAAPAAAPEPRRPGDAAGRIRQDHRGAGLRRCQRRLVHQPVQCLVLDLGRRHAARDGLVGVGHAQCRAGLGRAAQPQQGDQGRRRLSPHRHLELRVGRPPHDLARRAQRDPEPRRHAARPPRRPGRRQKLRLPALGGQDHRRLAGPGPARHRKRLLLGRGPVRARRAGAGARFASRSGARRARFTSWARPCSTPPASAA